MAAALDMSLEGRIETLKLHLKVATMTCNERGNTCAELGSRIQETTSEDVILGWLKRSNYLGNLQDTLVHTQILIKNNFLSKDEGTEKIEGIICEIGGRTVELAALEEHISGMTDAEKESFEKKVDEVEKILGHAEASLKEAEYVERTKEMELARLMMEKTLKDTR